jgi:hypothetical protein
MSVVHDAQRAMHLVDAATDLGNRLTLEEATAGLLAAAQLKAQGLGPVELRNLSTWSHDQRQLLRSWCRVGARCTGDNQKRNAYTKFLRELSRLVLENLRNPHPANDNNPPSSMLSERAWIEANGY